MIGLLYLLASAIDDLPEGCTPKEAHDAWIEYKLETGVWSGRTKDDFAPYDQEEMEALHREAWEREGIFWENDGVDNSK